MNFGLSQDQFKLLNDLVIQPLKNNKTKVYVFGSRARGDFHTFSDIDLLYIEDAKQPLNPAIISKIKEDIENSKLTIKVDIVSNNELAASYRSHVEKDLIEIL
jgi:predicted nucleotidyltransferase